MHSNLVTILRHHAETRADRWAYVFLADGEEEVARWTWADLDRRARAIAATLQADHGSGARALLLYPPGLDFVAGFLGCLYAGVVAVPAYPPASRRHLPRLQSIVDDAEPAVILTDAVTVPRLRRAGKVLPALAALPWHATDGIDLEQAAAWQAHDPEPDDLAFLQYTSGSTAAPKGVMVSHRNLVHNEAAIAEAFGQDEHSVVVGWLPLYHDMGLIGNALQPLFLGARCVLMAPVAFLQQPLRWLRAIERYRGTTSGGPNFAYDLCVRRISDAEVESLDLSSWTLAFSGAEPVRAETLQSFAERFAPQGFAAEAFYPCYGLAEATLMVTGGAKTRAAVVRSIDAAALERDQVLDAAAAAADAGGRESTRALVGCGRAWHGQRAVIVDPRTSTRCAPDTVGEIWVAGDSIALGYWKRPEATEETFRALLSTPLDDGFAGPFLRTGDLGFELGDEIFVTGRLKDLIIVRGRNHYPQDLERTAEAAHPSVRAGCGAAFSVDRDGEERLILVHELDRHPVDPPEVVADAVRLAVTAGHEVQVADVVLVRAGTVPKTSSGKIQRHACRRAYLDDALTVVGASALAVPETASVDLGGVDLDVELLRGLGHDRERRAAFLDWLVPTFARLAKVPSASVDRQTAFIAQGLDSLTAVELIHEIQQRFGVAVDMAELLDGASPLDLASRVVDGLFAVAVGSGTDPQDPTAPFALRHGPGALWYLHQMAPTSSAYHIGGAARVGGTLDLVALESAFQLLIQRHATLRTSFERLDGVPHGRVHDRLAVRLGIEDVPADETALTHRLATILEAPFDLEEPPLVRLTVLRHGAGASAVEGAVVALTMHHIVGDFWSLGVLLHELVTAYDAARAGRVPILPPPPPHPAVLARQEQDWLTGAEGHRLLAAWRERLAGPLPELDVPCDHPRPAVQRFRGGRVTRPLAPTIGDALRTAAQAAGTTPYVVVLAAFQTLLGRLSGQDDILVGSPTAGRHGAEVAGMVDYRVNPVVVRGDLGGDPTFQDLVARLRERVLEAFGLDRMPFSRVVEALAPERDPSRSPIFQAMLVFQQDRRPEDRGLASFATGVPGVRVEIGSLTLDSLAIPQNSAQLDLALGVAEVDGRYVGALTYDRDLFTAASASRLLERFDVLLAAALAAPGTALSALPVLTEPERARLLTEWNPPHDPGADRCLHDWIAAQAEKTPEAVALIDGEDRHTYAELVGAASRLARHLRDLGVGPETRVAICAPRDARLIVGLLGVLSAGGAYVPLDPTYPAERLAFTLEDGGAAITLVTPETVGLIDGEASRQVDLTPFRPEPGDRVSESPAVPVHSDNLAYIIYTSGSTGRPKGVAISHRSAATLVRWAHDTYSADELKGVLAATSVCFDLSIFEIFVPLTAGGTVILAANALALPTLPAAGAVTLLNTVPSAAASLVAGDRRLPPSLRTVNLAGEPLTGALARRVLERSSAARLYDLYGPSEDTTYSTVSQVRAEDPGEPTIGRAIDASQAYVVDRTCSPTPTGTPGELVLAGAGLARGYLGRPALTAERFVPNPFAGPESAGGRLYRTGDLVRWRDDGQLLFLGRLDHQVKIRGFRIELGEIELALEAMEAIDEVVVVATGDLGDQRLVAYLVPARASQAPSVASMRESLERSLPGFMVPQSFVPLDEMPRTPNGKIDRKALPAPEDVAQANAGDDFVAPSTDVEEALAEIWREVLGVERVGVNDSFFVLGGHSLLAIRVLTRVEEMFGVELPIQALLGAPTITGLARAIADALLADLDEDERAALMAELG